MRPSRARTPRARTSSAQDSRRASSVPAGGSSKPEWILDCVLLPPRKRKRTNTHEEPQPNGEMSRADPQRSDIKKLPKRVTRSQTRDDAPPSARTRSRSTAGAASSAHTPETRARRRAASSTRAVSETPSASSSAARPRRTSARTSTALGKLASTSRGSAVPASASALVTRRGRTSEKGKARARPAASDVSTTASVDDNWEVDSSASRTRRNVKRRRVSPPQLALRLDLDATEQDDAWDSQRTVVEEDFHMMDGPPDTLPWIPVNPHSEGSEYVPPGVNALIEDMKRALVVHRSERERAENRYAEEMQKRRELEQEAARLTAANRALEAERSAWTTAAAQSLASSLEDALVSDVTRRLTEEIFPSVRSSRQQPDSEHLPPSQSRPGAPLGRPAAGTVTEEADTDVEMSDTYTQRPSPGAGEERGGVHTRDGGPSKPPQLQLRNVPHGEDGTIPSEA